MMQLSPLLQLMQTIAGQIPLLEMVKIGVGIILCRLLKKIYDLEIAKDLQTKLKNQWEGDLEVFIAPHGKVWHTSAECQGLASAKNSELAEVLPRLRGAALTRGRQKTCHSSPCITPPPPPSVANVNSSKRRAPTSWGTFIPLM